MPYREKDCRKLYVTEFFFFWKILVTWGQPETEAEPLGPRGREQPWALRTLSGPSVRVLLCEDPPAVPRSGGPRGGGGPIQGRTLTPDIPMHGPKAP